MASTAAIEQKTEANKSFPFLDAAGLLLAQADEPYHQQQHPQQEQLNDVATPSQMDLSTGLMGLDSANTDEHQSGPAGSPGSESGPLFDPTTERNVTVLVGRTANLHCRVRYLGNRTVSIYLCFSQNFRLVLLAEQMTNSWKQVGRNDLYLFIEHIPFFIYLFLFIYLFFLEIAE